jgi:DNA-binding response OmpR family regulator
MQSATQPPLTILVVDDHADTTQFLVRLLARRGHVVSGESEYASALAAARGTRADLLICDIGLGGGRDGCDLLSEVRSSCSLKALALTGHDTPEVRARIVKAGFDGHLLKPVVFEELLQAIDALTQRADNSAASNLFGTMA